MVRFQGEALGKLCVLSQTMLSINSSYLPQGAATARNLGAGSRASQERPSLPQLLSEVLKSPLVDFFLSCTPICSLPPFNFTLVEHLLI